MASYLSQALSHAFEMYLPLSPRGLRRAFERCGFKMTRETATEWRMTRAGAEPFVIPKGDLALGQDVMARARVHVPEMAGVIDDLLRCETHVTRRLTPIDDDA